MLYPSPGVYLIKYKIELKNLKDVILLGKLEGGEETDALSLGRTKLYFTFACNLLRKNNESIF